MDHFKKSCALSDEYPLNLIRPNTAPYDLQIRKDLLCKISPRTFAPETKAALDFWEHRENGFFHTRVNSLHCLRDHLNVANQGPESAPLHRFVFIRASSSRTKLLLSEAMLKELFTYFQVMAFVVSMLASFGIDAGKDFQHCQFEADARLSPGDAGSAIPELKRSGRVMEIAYVFRTVEPSTSVEGMNWQIKQTCAYHSFDLETGLSTWILVKGSDVIKRRVIEGLRPPSIASETAEVSITESFLFSLNVHLMLSDLSVENWREYVNNLEREIQKVTRAITLKPIRAPTTAIPPTTVSAVEQMRFLDFRGRSRSRIFSQLSRSNTIKSWMSRMDITDPESGSATMTFPTPVTQNAVPPVEVAQSGAGEEEVYLGCLQEMKGLEEQALESLLVLKSAIRIWSQLQRAYNGYAGDEHFPAKLRRDCQQGLRRFNSRLDSTRDSLESQVLRVESLLALLSGRKTLLQSILEWSNMKIGNDVAIQATKSSIKMEEMTARMQEIADRTERETVSMRIITLVTMFFLPGTFISTLMSTDIVQFEGNRQMYSSSALKLFLAISLPMMGVTFCAWYVVYWFTNNREKVQRAKKRLAT